MEIWDHIIVGGGSSGVVLAARLSEDSRRRVLLIEAGKDFPDEANTPSILKHSPGAIFSSDFNWHLQAGRSNGNDKFAKFSKNIYSSDLATNPLNTLAANIPYFLGKVMGGSSSINGAIATRGTAKDFGQWVEAGNTEWSWNDVLPYYKKIETDENFFNELHGNTGPIHIRRLTIEELHPLHQAFLNTCETFNLPMIADLNGSDGTGVGKIPLNIKNQQRISSAIGYLKNARNRSNLKILSECLVQRILFEGQRAVAVEVNNKGILKKILANSITLSAGAIHTPAILQRSGIGDANLCRQLGIEVIVDLPGVGKNLTDHTAVVLWSTPTEDFNNFGQYSHQTMARVATQSYEPYDLQLLPLTNIATKDFPILRDFFLAPMAIGMSVVLSQPNSKGRVFISTSSAETQPTIEVNLCSDPLDIDKLMYGVRMAWKIIHSTQMRKYIDHIFLWTDKMIYDSELLKNAVTKFASPTWHPVGTAKMGASSDLNAVVTQHFQVYGTEQLTVVDASVMPMIPRSPTNLTCMMMAERAAEWIGTN